MAYPRGHNDAIRRKIVREARRAFNRHGYDAVTIDGIMTAAGLTRGAFYFHFKSKAELYREAIAFVLEEHPAQRWASDHPSPIPSVRLIDAYLSERHLNEVEESCPLVTHAAEAARSNPEVQQTFNSVLRALIDTLSSDLEAGDDNDSGLVIASLCVGGLSLARGIGDPVLAGRLLRATRMAVDAIARWSVPGEARLPTNNLA